MLPGIKGRKIKYSSYTEDSLTSNIFQLFFYLPKEIFENILSDLLPRHLIKNQLCDFISYEFWPKWDATGTSNKNYIEPDLILYFKELVIIVEAKRHDHKGQYVEQWKNELRAYKNEYFDDNRRVLLWALGGINNLEEETLQVDKSKIQVIKTTWSMVLQSVKEKYSQYERNMANERMDNNKELLKDLIYSFEIHGFFVGKWIIDEGFITPDYANKNLNYFDKKTGFFEFK